jgi:hypothetical protein
MRPLRLNPLPPGVRPMEGRLSSSKAGYGRDWPRLADAHFEPVVLHVRD